MKKIKTYMLLAATMLCSTSCLEKFPEDSVPADTAITTVEQANQAVIGIYSGFLSSALYSGYLTLLPDLQADLAYAVNGYSNTYGDFWRWEILGSNTQITSVYGALYDIIARCNFLLDNVAQVKANTSDDDDLDRLEAYCGEAYFARALAYSELIKMYCKAYESKEEAENELGVILTEHYNSNEARVRASLEDSYQFVLKDLDRAAEGLKLDDDYSPSTDGSLYNTTYFNEYTVYALRARIALYMKDYDEAVKYASKVIDSGYYTLSSASQAYTSDASYYQYMWQSDNSTEIIWKVGYTVNNYGGALGTIFFNYDYVNIKPDYVPALWVLNLYDTNDLRYSAFFREYTTSYDHGLTWPLLLKYWGNTTFISNRILHTSMPKVFRLSEQYLIRAEANVQLGKNSEAGKDITTLREARYLTYGGGTTMGSNKEDAMKIVKEERVKELYMEGFRLNDLKRWHDGFERTPQTESLSNGSSLKIEADNPLFVWPIPRHELEAPGSQVQPNDSNK